MAEDDDLDDKLAAAGMGAWAATVITGDAGSAYGFALVMILAMAAVARQHGLFEQMAERYGDRVREKLEILYEKSVVFGKKLSDFLFWYGNYVLGAMFLGLIAFVVVTPSLPFRGLTLAFLTFALIDWYFNDLRTIQDILFYWPLRPWRIFAVATAVAVYLIATGQSEFFLKLVIDFLQRGVSQ
ncbi:hypothetical protein [Natrinema sp. H-ect4]|uniref:hypothetical protein n=1 Tax=Natrinema sp. H-ect4 TaxID=3242699 RepID=UPI0035A916D6